MWLIGYTADPCAHTHTRTHTQVWELGGRASGSRGGNVAAVAPRMAAVLLHSGRVTWDVKWCPDPHAIATRPMRLVRGGGGDAGGECLRCITHSQCMKLTESNQK
jgi:hypothetical protein